jgi:hypothetical protein
VLFSLLRTKIYPGEKYAIAHAFRAAKAKNYGCLWSRKRGCPGFLFVLLPSLLVLLHFNLDVTGAKFLGRIRQR